MPFDKYTTQDTDLSTLPVGLPIVGQTQTDGGAIAITKIADGVKDSTNLQGVNASGEASVTDATAHTTLASILAKIIAAPATAANQSTELATLASILSDTDAILAKLSSDPATQTTLAAVLTKLNASIAVTGTFWQTTQPVSAASLPLPSGASTEATLGGVLTTSDFDTKVGALTETAPATDTASSGLNGRLQRIAQRISSLISSFTFGAHGVVVEGNASSTAIPVSAASLPLPSGAALDASVTALVPTTDFDSKIGSLTETAPSTDTASSGLNGRLQRIAQRISSLITSFTFGSHGVIVEGNASATAIPVSSSPTVASTGTQSSVAGSASSVTVLASNSARLGASVYNDSTAILYLLLKTGGTASTTVYTVQVAAAGYFEVPANFTGALIGIWASATGNARVTEYTA